MRSGVRVGVALVAFLAALVAAPACNRNAASSSTPATTAAPPTAENGAFSATVRTVLAWLPGDKPVAGWRRAGPAQVFGADNLWEQIDGGAETYVKFGFEELVVLPCREPTIGVDATIQVYRMADSLGAYGIYAQERNPNATFTTTGAEGYTAPNIVYFWNGPYYVKLAANRNDPRIATSLLGLATEIAARTGTPAPVPAGVVALPPSNQVPHSAKYLPRDVLGQSYLANGFEAQYAAGNKVYRLVTASFEAAQEAADAFSRYSKFLGSSGRVARRLSTLGDEGLVGSDSFNGSILAVRSGTTLVFALGAPSERVALDLIREHLLRLSHR